MLRELELEALQRFIIRLDLTSKPAFTMAYMVLGFHRFFHAFSTLCDEAVSLPSLLLLLLSGKRLLQYIV